MFTINKLAYCAVAMVSAAALAGCANLGASAATGAPEESAITVDSVPAAEEGGLYVAQANGFFQRQGLTVTINPITGGEAGIPDLQCGKAQLVGGNYVSFVLAQMSGEFGGKPASFRVVAPGAQILPGTEALYVLPDSRFQTVADLASAHARVGLNTKDDVGQVLLGALLAQDGDSFDSIDPVVPAGGFTALISMLRDRQVDAAWFPQPFGTMVQQQYGAVELADFDQGSLEEFPFTGYIGTSSWVASHPTTVAAFDRALAEGQQLADSDHSALEKAYEKYAGLPPIVAATMPFDTYPLTMSQAQLQRVSNAMYEFGLEPGRTKPYSTNAMLPRALGTPG